jgi:hypothetical protein
MLKPVYVAPSSQLGAGGWFIADESGALLPGGHAYAGQAECYEAIAQLSR